MTQALTRYQAMYLSLRSRARREPSPRGLDRLAARARLNITMHHVNPAWLRRQAEMTHALEPELRGHSERALDDLISRVREAMIRGKNDEETVRRALATVREVARRLTGESAYLVQLMGALALYHGVVIEMLTGEGKTLTGSIAAPLIAWKRRHLHIFTVNDYLAARDAQSRGPIYQRCLLDVGAIQQEQEPGERFSVYSRSIVYGTPKQMTADYLRDQIRLGETASAWQGRRLVALGDGSLAGTGSGPMVPGLSACMVDEADAVLVDEGVVPLIIAQPRRSDDMAETYKAAARIARQLVNKDDYTVELLRKRALLTEKGKARCAALYQTFADPIWKATRRAEELVRQALVAKHCYLAGQQYHAVEGRVVIVDEYTGRFLPDRSWEHGLHQAVEAKDNLEITADRETLARLSFQRFFRMYPFLCGMTGTAADATVEIERIYERKVLSVPTNRPMVRMDYSARVFRTSTARWDAVVDEIAALHKQGRPVLVGTRSIEASEHVAKLLASRALSHKVLNALNDKEEAIIIRNAGQFGSIVVATNMAGRGTDIKPEPDALKAGGLHVILTEMHSARRIDRQFRGRAGRQGDPGSSRLFLSLQDELANLYAPRLLKVVKTLATGGGEELSGSALHAARALFEHAQRRAQARARRGRGDVLRQDDWIDKNLPGM